MDEALVRASIEAERGRLRAVRVAVLRERGELDAEQAMDPTADEMLLEKEIDDSVLREVEAELAALDEAERRLDAGTYGTCAVCAAPLSEERLAALPSATRCTEHQLAAETLVEAREVEGVPSGAPAERRAAAEAGRNLDLVPDDEIGDDPEDREQGAEELAVHLGEPGR